MISGLQAQARVMFTISKKLFLLIMVGLSTLAVASMCSILEVPMDQAIIAFIVTWIAVIGIFEIGNFFTSDSRHDHHEH